MTALKQTKSSTALVRILALPIMVGVLAGCDYASKLPDAPGSLGGFDVSQKPPSVTGRGEAKRLPPPPSDAFAKLKAPVEDRTKVVAEAPKSLAMADKPSFKAPAPTLPQVGTGTASAGLTSPIDTPPLPTPTGAAAPLEQVAFSPLEFEAIEEPSATMQQPQTYAQSDFAAPAPALDVAAQSYQPMSAEAPTYAPIETQAYQSYESAPLDTYSVAGTVGQPEVTSYNPAPIETTTYAMAPVEAYSIAAPPVLPVESYSAPAPTNASPIAVLRSRLPNGAVVNVHPVIGAPGTASATLARTVVMNIGAPINEAAARSAAVAFDLRGRAQRNTDGYVSVEWKLIDSNKNVVGIFPERQDGGGWRDQNDEALRAMGQRVADRIARNGEMRKATLYAAANPVNTTYQSVQAAPSRTFILQRGATLAEAPMPRVSPRAATTFSAPMQVVARPAPVTMQPIQQAVQAPYQPYQAPRVATQPVVSQPRVITQAPSPLIAPAPIQTIPQSPQIVTQAPRPVAPPPAFDTLRPNNSIAQAPAAPTVVASGPRPLVFRGVQGAPGDGDQALGREVGKLLAQSGARMTNTPQPGALFLTAQVSKTPGANSDKIAIIWRVQDSNGENVGQVTQENDVPRGMLDNAWGEDAVYAAEGARDGIMELLQGVGALDS